MKNCYAVKITLSDGDIQMFHVGAKTLKEALKLLSEGHQDVTNADGHIVLNTENIKSGEFKQDLSKHYTQS
jgi:hypothetical protein